MAPRIDTSLFDRITQGRAQQLSVPGGGFQPPSESERDRERRFANDEVVLAFIAIPQVALMAAGAFLWWYLGGAMVPLAVGLLGGAIIAGCLYWMARSRLQDRQQVSRFDLFWCLKWAGAVLLGIFLSVLIGGLLQRIWEHFGIVFMVLTYVVFTPIVRRSYDAGESGKVEWFFVGSGLVFAPFFVAWSIASISWVPFTTQNSLRGWLDRQSASVRGVLTARLNPERCGNWTIDGQPIRVAVTLSGGGYRAALIHAGFLASLDAQCVPVHVLSTVSGGSIIGASYAMGVPPAQFAWQLATKQPGLPADIIKIVPVMSDLLLSFLGNITETYTDHFRRTFFGDMKLADLPDNPLLLVNVTDLQSGGDNAREVFFKKRAPSARFNGKSLDDSLKVAQIVAASGAFPGAFRPATLPWVEPQTRHSSSLEVKERQFVDGGVIDNLGVEGLRHYLTLPRADGNLPERPDLLIISDASALVGPELMSPSADAMTLIKRTTDYTYDLLHRHIYARYTGQGDLAHWIRSTAIADQVAAVNYRQIDSRLGGDDPAELQSVAIPSTAPVMAELLARYPTCRIDDGVTGEAVQKRVAGFATLYELSPRQVEEAFWLGRVMGQLYGPAIQCARKKTLGEPCSKVGSDVGLVLQCPRRRQLFQ
ncbi:MAG TPA: patatin-like phospholipase family protein [Candidatus Limnocylindrales bacterium]|nr:patatin-like phospholipase family protein [Candidatus Limnocylindrales bacterium]